LKGEGTKLKLVRTTHETTYNFHIVGIDFEFQHDGILRCDFWGNRKAVISYHARQIVTGCIAINFDPKNDDGKIKSRSITLQARAENYVKMPTLSKGQRTAPERNYYL
jgi:hypothetical protein